MRTYCENEMDATKIKVIMGILLGHLRLDRVCRFYGFIPCNTSLKQEEKKKERKIKEEEHEERKREYLSIEKLPKRKE